MAQRLPLDIDRFLSRYWQREPLLIRRAVPGFVPPVSADELAGLAMESGVESRLVEEAGGRWQVHQGPFAEADFRRSPPWTLLVQAVDHYFDEVAALQQLVDFLPAWRADDVMVSYATDGGSVGPHFDRYDVFLLQGEGRRLWRLGQRCDDSSPRRAGLELDILSRFDCVQEYVLDTGDMLYVPPGIAHWGIARGPCTTFSIGFRAPRRADLLARLTDEVLELNADTGLFSDPHRSPAHSAGELSHPDLESARQQAIALLSCSSSARWLGELVTEPRYTPAVEDFDESDLAALIRGEKVMRRAPGARLAWFEHRDAIQVFANGDSCEVSSACRASIIELCETGQLECQHDGAGTPGLEELLSFLLTSGGVCIAP